MVDDNRRRFKNRIGLVIILLLIVSMNCDTLSPQGTSEPLTDKAREAPPAAESGEEISPAASVRSDWHTYTNGTGGFQIQYPPDGNLEYAGDDSTRISLPIIDGTNLMEKFLDIIVSMDSVDGCNFSNRIEDNTSLETIGGIEFLVESSSEGAVGNVYQTLSYSVTNGSACVSFYFTLHSGNPGNYSPPIDEFDKDAESEIFEDIVATFEWLD